MYNIGDHKKELYPTKSLSKNSNKNLKKIHDPNEKMLERRTLKDYQCDIK